MTTYIIMEAEALAVMDTDTLMADPADMVTETLSLTAELAEHAIAVIATAVTATAAPALNALARAAMALELALATAMVLAASTAAEPAARSAATVLVLPGKWTLTLKMSDKATNWLWALAKALTAKKLLAAAAAKVKAPEPATETATIAVATMAKELLLAKAPVLVLEKAKVRFLMRAKARFPMKAKVLLLAKAPVLVLAKIAAAALNPAPTRWNRQLVLNRTLLPLVQLREQLLEWVLEVRALMVRTW